MNRNDSRLLLNFEKRSKKLIKHMYVSTDNKIYTRGERATDDNFCLVQRLVDTKLQSFRLEMRRE